MIQRVIEILRSVPTIPLWMGLAAAMPKTWSVQQVYFTITIIISLIGWTELARVSAVGFSHCVRKISSPPPTWLAPGSRGSSSSTWSLSFSPHHRRDDPGAAGDDHQRERR